MIDAELWVMARQTELDREAARIQLICGARKLAKAEGRGPSRRNGRGRSAPKRRHQTPSLDARGSWAQLF